MRIQIGRVVNSDADVNLADLKPIDKIIAAGLNAYHNTNMYRRRFAETEERKQEQLRKIKEMLIDSLVSVVTPEMEQNKLLQERGDVCNGLLIEVPARFKKCLAEVIDAHEFDAYEMTIIPPNPTLDKFANPPLLLLVTSRGG